MDRESYKTDPRQNYGCELRKYAPNRPHYGENRHHILNKSLLSSMTARSLVENQYAHILMATVCPDCNRDRLADEPAARAWLLQRRCMTYGAPVVAAALDDVRSRFVDAGTRSKLSLAALLSYS